MGAAVCLLTWQYSWFSLACDLSVCRRILGLRQVLVSACTDHIELHSITFLRRTRADGGPSVRLKMGLKLVTGLCGLKNGVLTLVAASCVLFFLYNLHSFARFGVSFVTLIV